MIDILSAILVTYSYTQWIYESLSKVTIPYTSEVEIASFTANKSNISEKHNNPGFQKWLQCDLTAWQQMCFDFF